MSAKEDEDFDKKGTNPSIELSREPHPYLIPHVDLRTDIRGPIRRAGRNQTAYDPHDGASQKAITSRASSSPSDSGTEADDESYSYVRALPPPPLVLRKGLRTTRDAEREGDITPLLTPTKLQEDALFYTDERYGLRRKSGSKLTEDDESRLARSKFLKRRRAELIRRVSECALCVVIGVLVLGKEETWIAAREWRRELAVHFVVFAFVAVVYPIRLLLLAYSRNYRKSALFAYLQLPAAFDPAPLVYPTFLPVAVALSLLPWFPRVLMPNLLLSLAALPSSVIPGLPNERVALHWLLSTLPLIISEHTDVVSKLSAVTPYRLKLETGQFINPEILICLFPLHHALLPFLQYLTTTSLLPAELHLLSIALINALFFSETPVAIILSRILWVGGIGLYILCSQAIKWEVALARIPRWRMRRAVCTVQAHNSFMQMIASQFSRKRQSSQLDENAIDSSDDTEIQTDRPTLSIDTVKAELLTSLRLKFLRSDENDIKSATERPKPRTLGDATELPARQHRRHTVSVMKPEAKLPKIPATRRKRRWSLSSSRYFLTLTPKQVLARKWLYALYVYLVILGLVLLPIRWIISRHALNDYEPFGWAIGYLFGNIQQIRFGVFNWNLSNWIPLPPLPTTSAMTDPIPRAEVLRSVLGGEANTRLALCAWCLAVLALGLGTVLSLPSVVEVDTRRKVFHGMMVAMLLPTIFIDPTFIALALALILAIFLILDLVRASQLPPLSRPIATFLTPYVDGRDLKGPVVVSHIFLLIGCAIPLWLSLAAETVTGEPPWQGWEVTHRDTSMIAGVVCVGMGDAAASLIGRRFGRRKWPWTGGKSLEGSAAFALAVTAGLMAGRALLWLGEWEHPSTPFGGELVLTTAQALVKAGFAACGASFMEAVLTGGNDNVVVPVILWLLVRAVGL